MSRIEQLISEIEEYIDSCKFQPLSNTKILVNKEEIEELLVELRLRIPDEIKKYQKIISNQEAILSEARSQADAMVEQATIQTNELVNEHEIMQKAYAQANEVVEQASQQAQTIIDNAIVEAKQKVTLCPICRNLTAGGPCPICANPKRDESLLCVVADPRDVIAMERAREFHGRYHVLHGVLSPMNHVGPDDLQIKPLVDRVAQGGIREVIMATNPDTEGETTALYLARLLKPFGVKVTRLAYGIPVGGHLEFADDATLTRALEGRQEL